MPKLPRTPPKRCTQLSFHLEVEADTDDPAAIQAIIEHIDNQISGLPQQIDVETADGINMVVFQVVWSHGQERDYD
jgi:hypothetical protein